VPDNKPCLDRDTPPTSAMKRRRLQRGLTHERLAIRTGLSITWIATVERAPQFMSEDVARKIALALGCEPADLR
jgi:transcriptional regulator with XRE-family HTH domain